MEMKQLLETIEKLSGKTGKKTLVENAPESINEHCGICESNPCNCEKELDENLDDLAWDHNVFSKGDRVIVKGESDKTYTVKQAHTAGGSVWIEDDNGRGLYVYPHSLELADDSDDDDYRDDEEDDVDFGDDEEGMNESMPLSESKKTNVAAMRKLMESFGMDAVLPLQLDGAIMPAETDQQDISITTNLANGEKDITVSAHGEKADELTKILAAAGLMQKDDTAFEDIANEPDPVTYDAHTQLVTNTDGIDRPNGQNYPGASRGMGNNPMSVRPVDQLAESLRKEFAKLKESNVDKGTKKCKFCGDPIKGFGKTCRDCDGSGKSESSRSKKKVAEAFDNHGADDETLESAKVWIDIAKNYGYTLQDSEYGHIVMYGPNGNKDQIHIYPYAAPIKVEYYGRGRTNPTVITGATDDQLMDVKLNKFLAKLHPQSNLANVTEPKKKVDEGHPFLDRLHGHANTQVLKYAAGQHITCPDCEKILDYRDTVVAEDKNTGRIFVKCGRCFDNAMARVRAKIGDDYAKQEYLANFDITDGRPEKKQGWRTATSVETPVKTEKPYKDKNQRKLPFKGTGIEVKEASTSGKKTSDAASKWKTMKPGDLKDFLGYCGYPAFYAYDKYESLPNRVKKMFVDYITKSIKESSQSANPEIGDCVSFIINEEYAIDCKVMKHKGNSLLLNLDEYSVNLLESLSNSVLAEAEYKGKKVELNKPTRGDVKKFKVFVKDPKTGNVKKVNFGDPNMEIKRDDPKRRKNFRARHGCGTNRAADKTKAAYWSCRMWSKKPVSKIVKETFDSNVSEMIVKQGDEWCVKSEKKDSKGHHKNMGCYTSKKGAKKRLGQVEYFKHKDD